MNLGHTSCKNTNILIISHTLKQTHHQPKKEMDQLQVSIEVNLKIWHFTWDITS